MRGKVIVSMLSLQSLQDHPRLCGEKVLENADGEQLDRITPAYAGKSVATLYSLVKVQDHPRLCGEKGKPGVLVTEEQGSPPPMRGKAALSGYDCTAGGITPAYAGKSCRYGRPHTAARDHPRLCGEKLLFVNQSIYYTGSPPPMRGKGEVGTTGCILYGITPAYAGKRSHFRSSSFPTKDHPRLCGEKCKYSVSRSLYAGSPPPMRGKGRRCKNGD